MSQEPQIIELDDPEGAPRLMAFILLACGLLGVGFLLVNVIFTGDDQYYIESEWNDGNEPVNQRFDVIPSIVRMRPAVDEADEDNPETDEKIKVLKKKQEEKRTKPGETPFKPFQPITPSTPTLPGQKTPGGPITPGTPGGAGAAAPK